MDRLKKYGMYKMEFYFVGKNKIMTFLGKQMISWIIMLKEMKSARFRKTIIICILSIIKYRIKKVQVEDRL